MRVSWRIVTVSPSAMVSVMVPPLAEVFAIVVPANMLASIFAASLLVFLVHGVHGACFLFCVGARFYCSARARVLSTRVRGCTLMWERPSFCLAGAFFYVGASYARAGAMCACLAPGALIFGGGVRAGGVNDGLAARETEVRGH